MTNSSQLQSNVLANNLVRKSERTKQQVICARMFGSQSLFLTRGFGLGMRLPGSWKKVSAVFFDNNKPSIGFSTFQFSENYLFLVLIHISESGFIAIYRTENNMLLSVHPNPNNP